MCVCVCVCVGLYWVCLFCFFVFFVIGFGCVVINKMDEKTVLWSKERYDMCYVCVCGCVDVCVWMGCFFVCFVVVFVVVFYGVLDAFFFCVDLLFFCFCVFWWFLLRVCMLWCVCVCVCMCMCCDVYRYDQIVAKLKPFLKKNGFKKNSKFPFYIQHTHITHTNTHTDTHRS